MPLPLTDEEKKRQEEAERKQNEYYVNLRVGLDKFNDKIYDEWRNDYKTRTGKEAAFTYDERNRLTTGDADAHAITALPGDFYWANNKDNEQAHADWRSYHHKKNAERFNKLDSFSQEAELSTGGVSTVQDRRMDAFAKTAYDKMLLDIPKFYRKTDPVYGKRFDNRYEVESTAGAVLGEVASFAALSFAAGAAKVPRVIQLAAESPSIAGRVVKATGGPIYALGTISKASELISKARAGLAYTQAEAAGHAGSSALIMSIKNTVQENARRYSLEDSQSKSEYEKNLALPLRDFLVGAASGYGIAALNAPGAWTLRFMGDALYSTASTTYDVWTGKQPEFSAEQFLSNFIIGHVFGEIAGRALNPYEKAFRNDKMYQTLKPQIESKLRGLGLNEVDISHAAAQATMAGKEHFARTGQGITPKQLDQLADTLVRQYRDPAVKAFLAKKDFSDGTEADLRVIGSELDKGTDEAYNILARTYKWSTADLEKAKQQKLLDAPDKAIAISKFNKLAGVPGFYSRPDSGVTRDDFVSAAMEQTEARMGKRWGELMVDRATRANAKVDAELKAYEQKTAADEAEVENLAKKIEQYMTPGTNRPLPEYREHYDNAQKVIGEVMKKGKYLRRKWGDEADDIIQDASMRVWRNFPDKYSNEAMKKAFPEGKDPHGAMAFKILSAKDVDFARKTGKKRSKETRPERDLFDEESDRSQYDVESLRQAEEMTAKEREESFLEATTGKTIDQLDLEKELKSFARTLEEATGGDFKAAIEAVKEKDMALMAAVVGGLREKGYEWGEIEGIIRSEFIGNKIAKTFLDKLDKTTETKGRVFNKLMSDLRSEIKKRQDVAGSGSEGTVPREVVDAVDNARASLNRKSGFNSIINKVDEEAMAKNGAFTIDLAAHYKYLAAEYGRPIADRLVAKASSIMRDHLSTVAKDSIYIKHPNTTDDAQFVIINKGLPEREFNDTVSDVYRILTSNYDDAGVGKRWGLVVKRNDDDVKVLTGFRDILAAKVNNRIEMDKATLMSAQIRQLISSYGDNTMLDEAMHMYTSMSPRAAAMYDTIMKDHPWAAKPVAEWPKITTEEVASLRTQLGELMDNMGNFIQGFSGGYQSMKNAVASRLSGKQVGPEDITNPIQGNEIAKQQERLEADIGADRHMETSGTLPFAESIEGQVESLINSLKEHSVDMAAYRQANASFGDKAKGKIKDVLGYIKALGKGTKDWSNKYFNIYGETEKTVGGRKTIDAITGVAGTREQTESKIAEYVGNLYTQGLAGLQRNQKDFINRILYRWYETEAKQVIDFDDLDVAINERRGFANDVQKPIVWKRDQPAQFDRELSRVTQMDDETLGESLLTLKDASKDDLFYSKLLHRYGGMSPQQIVDWGVKWHNDYHFLVKKAHKGAGGLPMSDQDVTVMKSRMASAIYAVINDMPELRAYKDELAAIDLEGAINTIRKNKTTGADEEIKMPARDLMMKVADKLKEVNKPYGERLKALLNMYYEYDPSKLSYVHHVVMRDRVNQKTFKNEVMSEIKGEPVGGSRALSPMLDQFTGRKIATLDDLIAAGYVVKHNAAETDVGVLTALLMKNINTHMAYRIRSEYVKDFAAALRVYARDRVGNPEAYKVFDDFFEQHGAYVYMPTKEHLKEAREIYNKAEADGKMTKEIEDTKDALELLYAFQTGSLIDKVKEKVRFEPTAEEQAYFSAAGVGQKTLMSGEHLPMNAKNWAMERGAHGGKIPLLEAMENTVKYYNLNAPNIYGWDGIYFNKDIHRIIRQFITRDEGMYKGPQNFMVQQLTKLYDAGNRGLKSILMKNPTIMFNNNVMNLIAGGPSMAKDLPWAWKALMNKDKAGEVGNDMYWFFNGLNLFGRASAPQPVMAYAQKAAFQMLGSKGYFGQQWNDLATEAGLGKNAAQKIAKRLEIGVKRYEETMWQMDDLFRLASAKHYYDKAIKGGMSHQEAGSAAVRYTNKFFMEYGRIPNGTKNILNRLFMFPVYRIQTFRLYKEALKMGWRGLKGIFTGKVGDTDIRMFKDDKKQAAFELATFARTISSQAAIKGVMALLFGYSAASLFDMLTDYRLKKDEGSGYGRDIKILSLSGPIFDWAKYSRRPIDLTVKYNLSAIPGLALSLLLNKNLYTQEKIFTDDAKGNPAKLAAQFGMHAFRSYFPWNGMLKAMSDDDLKMGERIITVTGLANFYSQESPEDMLKNFQELMDKSKTPQEREFAVKQFQQKLNKAYYTLYQKPYKDMADEMLKATTSVDKDR